MHKQRHFLISDFKRNTNLFEDKVVHIYPFDVHTANAIVHTHHLKLKCGYTPINCGHLSQLMSTLGGLYAL
jgi:hypothetical protein